MGKKTKKKIKYKKISNLKGGRWFFSPPKIEVSIPHVKTEIKRLEPITETIKKGIIFKSKKFVPKEVVEFNGKKYSIETTKDMLGRRKIIIRNRDTGQLLERKNDPTSHFILRNYIKKYPTQGYLPKNLELHHQYYNGSKKHYIYSQNKTTKNILGTPEKIKNTRNWWSLGLFRKKKAFTKTTNPEEHSLEATRDRVRALEAQSAKNSEERKLYQLEIRAREEKEKLEEAKAKATSLASAKLAPPTSSTA